ncbi:hypothetical protein HMPREF0005_05376, partial [Achromobacter xylosoxidans C54]
MALAINALAQRLRATPDDADGWYTLARSYETLGRYDDAAAAYREVLQLVPAQPQVLADLADALLSANQGAPDAASIAAVAQALAANPDQPKALALAGMMALRRGDAAQALEYWQRLQALLPPDSEAARQIESNIAQARAVASASGAPPATPGRMPGQMPGQTQAAAMAAAQSSPPQTSAIKPPASQAAAPGSVSGQARIAPGLDGPGASDRHRLHPGAPRLGVAHAAGRVAAARRRSAARLHARRQQCHVAAGAAASAGRVRVE